jgi:catechol 2,3-dioxygenase-like lactoylglutathione lyase family enzyme
LARLAAHDNARIAGYAQRRLDRWEDEMERKSQTQPAVLADAVMGYVFTTVRDVAVTRTFYRDVLGFRVVFYQEDACVFLDLGGAKPQLAFYAGRAADAPRERDWFFAVDVADLDAVVAALKAAGVAVSDIETVPNGRAAWFLDPDGLKIEVHQPE